MSDALNRCEWVRERIDACVDGAMDADERAVFEAHCATCAACARELSLAIRIRRELRTLPVFDMPAHVLERAAQQVAAASSNVIPLRASRPRRRVAPIVAAAAIAAIVAAAAWIGIERRAAAGYSEAEIRRAHAEMSLAFGYVDRYSDGVVRQDVMERRVIPRIERAVRGNDAGVTSPAPERS